MFFPYIDVLKSPTYYFIYAYQIVLSFIAAWMHLSLTTFFTTTSIFSLLQIKTLQHLLINIKHYGDTNEMIDKKLNKFIVLHEKIINYVKELNNFVAYMCLSELLCYGFLLCALLLLLNIVSISNKLT